jgi:hypothetical protein
MRCVNLRTLLRKKFFLLVFCAYFTIFLFSGGAERKSFQLSIGGNLSCGRYPLPADITVDNVIWQELQIRKGFVKILNAYADKRPFLNDTQTFIKLNVASVELNSSDVLFCQFWYENSVRPVVTKASSILLIWREKSLTKLH